MVGVSGSYGRGDLGVGRDLDLVLIFEACALPSCARPRLTPQGIDHLQTSEPATMAEVLGEEHGAAAADRRLGDQGIESAELFVFGQQMGSEHEIGVAAHHLEAIQRVQDAGDVCRWTWWQQLAAGHRAQFDQHLRADHHLMFGDHLHQLLLQALGLVRLPPVEPVGPEVRVDEHAHQCPSSSGALMQRLAAPGPTAGAAAAFCHLFKGGQRLQAACTPVDMAPQKVAHQRIHRGVLPQCRLPGPLQQGVVDRQGEIGHAVSLHRIRGARAQGGMGRTQPL